MNLDQKKNSWGRLSLLSALQIMLSLSLHPGTLSLTTSSQYRGQKSDNLQYNMLGRRVAGTNDSSTKRLMFQVLLFFIISCKTYCKKSFQFIFFFFHNFTKIKIKSFECPKSIRNVKKKCLEHQTLGR